MAYAHGPALYEIAHSCIKLQGRLPSFILVAFFKLMGRGPLDDVPGVSATASVTILSGTYLVRSPSATDLPTCSFMCSVSSKNMQDASVDKMLCKLIYYLPVLGTGN